jgi:hypothetical protein
MTSSSEDTPDDTFVFGHHMPILTCSIISMALKSYCFLCRDCVVYAARCQKLGGGTVVLKVYDKSTISAVKHRSIRREARIMRYLTESK